MAEPVNYPQDVVATFFEREELVQKLRAALNKRDGNDAPQTVQSPKPQTLLSLVETMLFVSMATEEGRVQSVGVVFAENHEDFAASHYPWDFVRLKSYRPFGVEWVTKLAAICDFPNSYLAVVGERLQIAGVATPHSRSSFGTDSLVRVIAPKPGVVVVTRGTREVVRYARGRIPPQPPEYLQFRRNQPQVQLRSIAKSVFSLQPELSIEQLHEHTYSVMVFSDLFRVVAKMSQLGYGGILAILGPGDSPEGLVGKAPELSPPLDYGGAIRAETEAQQGIIKNAQWNRLGTDVLDEVVRHRERLVRFTSVDGAVLLSHSLQVIAFGVKLPSIDEGGLEVVSVDDNGYPGGRWPLDSRGTRHKAAASFAKQHPGGLAFIVSQDGDAAVFQALEAGTVVHWPLGVPLVDSSRG